MGLRAWPFSLYAVAVLHYAPRPRPRRSAWELGQPPLEEAPLGVRVNKLERAVVGRAGVFDAIEPSQQLGLRRVQIVVAVELEALHQGERGLDMTRFGDSDG